MPAPRSAWSWLVAAALLAGCGGDPSRSATCGFALVAGPSLIQQRLNVFPAVIGDPPRGLPEQLPARIVAGDTGRLVVAYTPDQRALVAQFLGSGFPTAPGYALLVVDDSSQRAMGVLMYEREGPDAHPQLGTVTGPNGVTLPLFGVRVGWTNVSDPRCPLFAPLPE